MFYSAPAFIFQRAKELRSRLTYAEGMLWMYLRTKPKGYKFRRQHPIRQYIVDFYCHSLKLVIEVDGPIHDREENKKADMERQHNLEAEGLRVIRFTNDEVRMNMENIIEQINTIINEHARTNTVD